jgi:hypothetical protein
MSKSKIYDRAEAVYRLEKLRWYQRVRATGWDNATLKDIAHLTINDEKLYAVCVAIEEALEALGGERK